MSNIENRNISTRREFLAYQISPRLTAVGTLNFIWGLVGRYGAERAVERGLDNL